MLPIKVEKEPIDYWEETTPTQRGRLIEMVVGKGLCPLLVAETSNTDLEFIHQLLEAYDKDVWGMQERVSPAVES